MTSRVIVVTGGNKGIGYSSTKLLSKWKAASDVLYLCSRDQTRGAAAAAALKQETGVEVVPKELDIDSEKSIKDFAAFIKVTHGGLDVLVNNAGIACSDSMPFGEQATATTRTNYYGTLAMTKAMLPLLRDGARVVNVSSTMGNVSFGRMSAARQEQFDDANLTEAQLSQLIQEFVAAAAKGTNEAEGFSNTCYGTSKTAVTALTRLHQRDVDACRPQSGVVFSAVCPGFCDTDMTRGKGPRSPDEGADVVLHTATFEHKADVPKGKFWFDRKVVGWR